MEVLLQCHSILGPVSLLNCLTQLCFSLNNFFCWWHKSSELWVELRDYGGLLSCSLDMHNKTVPWDNIFHSKRTSNCSRACFTTLKSISRRWRKTCNAHDKHQKFIFTQKWLKIEQHLLDYRNLHTEWWDTVYTWNDLLKYFFILW